MSNVRPLTEHLQKVAIEELNEVPERVAEDIEALQTWIEKEPHLRARTDPQFLLAFLRGCKYSLEKAKSKIDKYYMLRSKYPDFFTIQNVDDPRVVEMIKIGVGIPLPTPLHENGARIVLVRMGSYPTDKFDIDDVMCIANTLTEVSLLEDDYSVVNGTVNVMDMSNVTGGHLLQMTPTVMKKMSTYSKDATPLRPQGMHFINTPTGFQTVYKILKPMMPEKQQERMYVHGADMDALYEHIPQKYLPIEYGGENGSIPELINNSYEKFQEYRDFFMSEKNYGTDEHLRVGGPIDFDTVFGVEGSFRKLNVD